MKQVANGPVGWIPYVLVDDVRASTDKAKSLGGEVMKDVTEMPDMGSFSIMQYPTGSVLGLWQHNPKMMEAEEKAKETALMPLIKALKTRLVRIDAACLRR